MKYAITEVTANGVTYLTTPDFLQFPELAAGFSTRAGGVSQGCFGQFNFGLSRGDDPDAVRENYRIFAAALGADAESIAAVRQVHSATVLTAPQDGVANPFVPAPLVRGDGVVTAQPGLYPACYYADCIPLLLYAPESRICGAVHAGWRGVQQRILARAVEAMAALGADPADLLLAIGPSICADCFEVGDEVVELFRQAFPGRDELIVGGHAKPHIDLWRAVELTALEAGLREERITCLGHCSFERSDEFFSHRIHREERGVLMALIGVRPDAE